MTDDRFLDNTAVGAGGVALENGGHGASTVDGDEFDGDVATQNYAGLAILSGPVSSTGSSFIGNRAGVTGGAVTINATTSLVDATISDNTAQDGAGFAFAGGAKATLTNDTIAFNRASSFGGGVAGASAAASGSAVHNTIVAENTGGDCGNLSGSPDFPAADDAGNNLDGDGTCFQGDGQATDKVAVNPMLGAPADNGGAVQTDALTPGSPAIDAGTTTCSPPTDARGVVRPQGSACDMGAFEYAASTLSLSDQAPATAASGVPFSYTLKVSAHRAGPSTATTVSDQLPPGSTLYASSPAQGSCTATGTPPKVTCALGALNSGGSATISLLVSIDEPGPAVDTATATNGEGSAQTASATTLVQTSVAPPGATSPTASTGTATPIGAKTVRLGGSVNPGGQPTAYFFELGQTRSYGTVTPLGNTGSAPQSVSVTARKLSLGKRYHYRLVAVNDSGTSYGRDRTFRMPAGKLKVNGSHLTVRSGSVLVPLSCASGKRCRGSFSIVGGGGKHRGISCARGRFALKGHGRTSVKAPLRPACLAALRSHNGKLDGSLNATPTSPQLGEVGKSITLVMR